MYVAFLLYTVLLPFLCIRCKLEEALGVPTFYVVYHMSPFLKKHDLLNMGQPTPRVNPHTHIFLALFQVMRYWQSPSISSLSLQ